MKLISLASRLAIVGFAAFVIGFVLDTQALAFFAFSVAAFVLLIVVGDYTPRASLVLAKPHRGTMLPFAPANARAVTTEKLAA